MRNPRPIILCTLALTIALMACSFGGLLAGPAETIRGSGVVASESRPVQEFDAILLSGFGEILLDLGERPSLRVEAEAELLPYLETVVEGRQLEIRTRRGFRLQPTRPVRYHITMPDLDSVRISGSGDLQVVHVDVDRLDLSISGSGDIQIGRLLAERLGVDISGSGHVEVEGGEVGRQEIRITGSGECFTDGMASSEARVEITGSGEATVWARESLNVRITGSGDVGYYGSPQTSVSGRGSGEATHLGNR